MYIGDCQILPLCWHSVTWREVIKFCFCSSNDAKALFFIWVLALKCDKYWRSTRSWVWLFELHCPSCLILEYLCEAFFLCNQLRIYSRVKCVESQISRSYDDAYDVNITTSVIIKIKSKEKSLMVYICMWNARHVIVNCETTQIHHQVAYSSSERCSQFDKIAECELILSNNYFIKQANFPQTFAVETLDRLN